MSENYRNSIGSLNKLPQFTTMNVIDGQAGLVNYSSLIFYSLTIDNILNIIVLLILASVSIAMLTGENGILTKANEAKYKSLIAGYEEELRLIEIEAQTGDVILKDGSKIGGTLSEKIISKSRELEWVEDISESESTETASNIVMVSITTKEKYEIVMEIDNENKTVGITTSKTAGEKYKITYDLNGGSGEKIEVEVKVGYSTILKECTYTKEYNTFVGWSETSEGKTTMPSGTKYKPTGDVTLYAIWSSNPATIIYDPNVGTGSQYEVNALQGKEITITEIGTTNFSAPSKEKHFKEWNTQADGNGTAYSGDGTDTLSVTKETTTLYAIWENHTYSNGACTVCGRLEGLVELKDANDETKEKYKFGTATLSNLNEVIFCGSIEYNGKTYTASDLNNYSDSELTNIIIYNPTKTRYNKEGYYKFTATEALYRNSMLISGGGFEYLGTSYEVLNEHSYVSTELKDSSDDIKSTYKFKTDNATGYAAYGNETIKYEEGFEVGDIVYVAEENTYGGRWNVLDDSCWIS